MRSKLTQKSVCDLVPRDRRYVAWDAVVTGFGVRVAPPTGRKPAGRKSFVFAYRMRGSRAARLLTIGDFPSLTVEAARQIAREHVGSVARGVDPAAIVRRPAAKAATGPTVQEAVTRWLDNRRSASPRYVKECRAMLENYIAPAVGRVPLAKLTREQVEALYHTVAGQDQAGRPLHPFMANRVYSLLRAVCRRAVEDDVLVKSPCRLSQQDRFREAPKDRFLSEMEQRAFHGALDTALSAGLPQPPAARRRRKRPPQQARPASRKQGKFQPGVRPADPHSVAVLRLLLLTGMRLREALGLKWSEVDSAGFLRLERSKTGRSIRPIGAAALTLLEQVRTLPHKTSPYVFPSQQERTPHLKSISALWEAVKHEAGLDGVRLHDLRHTFASNMIATGANLPEVAAALGQSNLQTAARYSHLTQEAVRRAVDRAAARGAPDPAK
jgi:integrase